MTKYRPKKFITYSYGTEYKAYVNCYPQSRWELIKKSDREVVLANKHTAICMTPEDFEKHWVKAKKKGRNK